MPAHALALAPLLHEARTRAGYGGTLTPNPGCVVINLCVTLQTIISLMVDYSMLGLVYAR